MEDKKIETMRGAREHVTGIVGEETMQESAKAVISFIDQLKKDKGLDWANNVTFMMNLCLINKVNDQRLLVDSYIQVMGSFMNVWSHDYAERHGRDYVEVSDEMMKDIDTAMDLSLGGIKHLSEVRQALEEERGATKQ